MTAEVAILNRHGVALAADSAVTVRRGVDEKIFDTANKLFMLSKIHPVGVLIYGSASLLGVPWETIVKDFRSELQSASYDRVEEYGGELIKYLETNASFFPPKKQADFVRVSVLQMFHEISQEIDNLVQEKFEERKDETGDSGEISEKEIRESARGVITEWSEIKKRQDYLQDLDADFERGLGRSYSAQIRKAREAIFEDYPLTRSDTQKLNAIARMHFCRRRTDSDLAGVVVAGFGEDQFFPAFAEYEVHGVACDRLLYSKARSGEVTWDDTAQIVPFAQSDMVHLFMEGVTPRYQQLVEISLSALRDVAVTSIADDKDTQESDLQALASRLADALNPRIDHILNALDEFRREDSWGPVMESVTHLPKDQLAEMAESLVNLTSFQRRVSLAHSETVGGETDVAVISKGDGFVWIRRKHYFEAELNHHFFTNYFKEV